MEDIYPKNLLYAVTIRSPAAKGKLRSIYVSPLPDDYLLITAKDIPGENRLENTRMPILADNVISYIGEPVAIILGPDKTRLEELAAKCKVIADEEEPVFNCTDKNAAAEITREIIIGNTKEIFESSGKITTGSYTTGIQDHWYAEPAGAVTWWAKQKTTDKSVNNKKTSSTLVVRTATQWPHHVKRSVVRALKIDPGAVSVEPTALGLHMDGKLWYPSLLACHAALGTYITKKPVRFILTSEEDFLYTTKRCQTNIDITCSIDENDNINAASIEIAVNLGAYGVYGEEILEQVCLGCLGFYDFKNLILTAKAMVTNLPPQGAFCGFGMTQGLYAAERCISQIADMLGHDPALWRMNRVNTSLISPVLPAVKKNTSGEELIKYAVKISDYHRKWASNELLRQSRMGKTIEGEKPRGIGIAVGYQSNGLLCPEDENSSYSVEVTLTKDSCLEIKSSITSSEDYQKIWEKIAMETMSIEAGMVRIVSADSPDCGPSCSSRNITLITKLVEKCCLAIRKQRFRDPLPITVRRSAKPAEGTLRNGSWKVKDITSLARPGLAAAVVEVSIDLVECLPVIRGVWLAVDCGKIISANRAKRNLTRSITQALGWAFTENIEYKDGVIPKIQYDNFSIYPQHESHPIHVEFFPGDKSEPKGAGELPFTCIPAAFMQAVSQAMDHDFNSIPLKKKDIWEMISRTNLKIEQEQK
ncbi:MAG: molybdopterin-dependent oxidoreductase [Treponema sp.]|nr:molybdopterin-dependent oxidoreductase [Treponema sp.]